jgi:hypothetical protein
MADDKKLTPPQWLGRPILDEDHVQDLETNAAINEFHRKMPRAQAEQRAYEDYVQEQRARAAAYHLAGMKAAMAAGNREDARKHWALYDLHLKALGKESVGAVPPEVQKWMEDQKPVYRFKAHKGDMYVLYGPSKGHVPPQKSDEPAVMAKAEAKRCKWRLGERRCQRMVTTGDYCHDHVERKVKQKKDAEAPADMEKADMPSVSANRPPSQQLHNSVEGFMGALKAIPKGDPARGKLITAHMNHAPFLQALQQHPQGKQIHQMLTQHLNSTANAGFRPGAAKVTLKG